MLAFPLIFLLSLLFFRSLVAALLPPLLGGLAIVTTFFVLRVISNFTDLSVFALNLVTGLGLGLAIDYSLFMVSRVSRRGGPFWLRCRGVAAHAADCRADDPVQLGHGGGGARRVDDLPPAVPLLHGSGGCRRRACRSHAGAGCTAGPPRRPRSAGERDRALGGCSAWPTTTPCRPKAEAGIGSRDS